ncbi:MAG: hypothetical protein AB7N76_14455 [Planctomycetota bacterium]
MDHALRSLERADPDPELVVARARAWARAGADGAELLRWAAALWPAARAAGALSVAPKPAPSVAGERLLRGGRRLSLLAAAAPGGDAAAWVEVLGRALGALVHTARLDGEARATLRLRWASVAGEPLELELRSVPPREDLGPRAARAAGALFLWGTGAASPRERADALQALRRGLRRARGAEVSVLVVAPDAAAPDGGLEELGELGELGVSVLRASDELLAFSLLLGALLPAAG